MKKDKFKLCSAFAILAFFLIMACANPPNLVGKWQEYQKKVKHFFFTFFRQHSPCSDFTDFLKIQFRLYLRSKRDSKIGVFGGTPYPRCSIFWHTGMTRSAGIAAIRAPWSHNKDGSNGQGRHSCHSHQ